MTSEQFLRALQNDLVRLATNGESVNPSDIAAKIGAYLEFSRADAQLKAQAEKVQALKEQFSFPQWQQPSLISGVDGGVKKPKGRPRKVVVSQGEPMLQG